MCCNFSQVQIEDSITKMCWCWYEAWNICSNFSTGTNVNVCAHRVCFSPQIQRVVNRSPHAAYWKRNVPVGSEHTVITKFWLWVDHPNAHWFSPQSRTDFEGQVEQNHLLHTVRIDATVEHRLHVVNWSKTPSTSRIFNLVTIETNYAKVITNWSLKFTGQKNGPKDGLYDR